MPKMDTTAGLVIILFALFKNGIQGLENPGKSEFRQYQPGMAKFDWETTSRLDEYSVRGTTYYSATGGLYRFDANDGLNQLFIFPHVGKAYYYFSRFANGRTTRLCYKMRFRPYAGRFLPIPIPTRGSLKHYEKGGYRYYRGEQIPRYFKDTIANKLDGNSQYFEEREILFPNFDRSQFPVRMEFKKWITDDFLRKYRLNAHEVTDYYGFSFSVTRSDFTLPFEDGCNEVLPDDSRGASINAHALVVHVPEELRSSLSEKPDAIAGSLKTKFLSSAGGDEMLFPDSENYYENYQNLPLSWDWRDYGAVTSVKNQRDCGSCWAFGAVGALESAYFLKYNQSVVLSEQFLLDCSWISGNEGCAQGSAEIAFEWSRRSGGIPLTEDYGPYKNMNGQCAVHEGRMELHAQIKAWGHIPSHPHALKSALVNYGPIVVHIASKPMLTYTSGIITDCDAENKDHFVLIVGYGETRDSRPYWIVKNSWGNTWGMDGYALISARPHENCLGILDKPISLVLQ